MPDLEPMVQNLNSLTPVTVGLVVVAGFLVGIAPSSFPLLSVAAGMAASQVDAGKGRIAGFWLSAGFALGIATVDAVIGFLFGLAGFAVMRVLASVLAIAYGVLALLLIVAALALLRIIRVPIPVLVPSPKPTQSFYRSYIAGLPFGLSTCPACTPLILPVVAAAAATADPVMGGVLMFAFGLARGVPIVVTGTVAGKLFHSGRTRAFIRWGERIGAALMLGAAAYFVHQAAFYAGWLSS